MDDKTKNIIEILKTISKMDFAEMMRELQEIAKQQAAAVEPEWNRKPKDGEKYMYFDDEGDLRHRSWAEGEYASKCHHRMFNCFQAPEHNRGDIIADGVRFMSAIQRAAYKIGKGYRDWLTTEERNNPRMYGYSSALLKFSVHSNSVWHAVQSNKTEQKWFKAQATAEELTHFLNLGGYDYLGRFGNEV